MRSKKVDGKNQWYYTRQNNKRIAYNIGDQDKAEVWNRDNVMGDVWEGECYLQQDPILESDFKKEDIVPSGIYCYNEGNQQTDYNDYIETIDVDFYPRLDIFNDFNLKDEIDTFVDKADVYHELKVPHKRGFLLYGPPGTGKTTFITNTLAELDIPGGYIALYIKDAEGLLDSGGMLLEGILQDDRLKIFILEELTEMGRCMSEILNLLDGIKQLSGVVFIATTNYPEKLPRNLVNRPSRFDIIKEVGYLTEGQIVDAFCFYSEDPSHELLALLDEEKITFSHVKEICLKSRLNDISLLESFEGIQKQLDIVNNCFEEEGDRVGF